MRIARASLKAASVLQRSEGLTGRELQIQWQNPSDVLSVLLIIGGDIVQKALAQLSGGLLTPVAFSFGWVAYSFTVLVALVGDGRLMPVPDFPCKVINTESGYVRENRSWVISRLLRRDEEPLLDEAMVVSVYRAQETGVKNRHAGRPVRGMAWYVGLGVIALQIGIAIIPLGLYGDWGIFMITGAGTLLALITGSLPQWRVEKYACRKKSKKVIAITQGNGSRHVVLILGNRHGLDLEDLAAGEGPRVGRPWEECGWFVQTRQDENGNILWENPPRNAVPGTLAKPKRMAKIWAGLPCDFWMTRGICLALAVFWVALLIAVAGLKRNAWFLLLVGSIGMVQNAIVAGIDQYPGTQGIHLDKIDRFSGCKVMDVLMDLDVVFPGAGRALVKEFFPGGLNAKYGEPQWWEGNRAQYDADRCSEPHRGKPRSME
jgi:hypothetical protein